MSSEKNKIPKHVAIIMDGNGRWAQKSGIPRTEGYSKGSVAVEESVRYCVDHQISALTLYAFSTENWSRSQTDVNFLMKLLRDFLVEKEEEMPEKGICLRWIGRRDRIAKDTREIFERIIEKTARNNKLILTLAVDYGARDEILRATQRILKEFKQDPETLNAEIFESYLDTHGLPELDLLIRTSGEMRISNFLLYQAAYSELYFSDKYWPEFTYADFALAIQDFSERERSYGKNRSG